VSSPSAPAAWAPMPRRLAGTAYSAVPDPAGTAWGYAPSGSGWRASGVAMTLFLSCFLVSSADDDRRAAALVVSLARLRELSSGSVLSFVPLRSLRWCRLGQRGGFGLRGAGEVGAADPDRGDVDGQGEQRDGGGGQERAGEPGGEGVVVDCCGQRPAGAGRVPGPRGGGGLGVDAVGDHGPGDGAEQRQADGAAELLA